MSSKTDDATTEKRGTKYAFLLVVGLLWLTSCAVRPGSATLQIPQVAPKTAPILVAQASSSTSPPASATDQTPEEPFDPFAQPGEAEVEEYDPWEPLNTRVFEFNRQVDRWVLKPVATVYDIIVPNPVQIGISNFFYNLRFTPRFVNNILQGKIKGAGIEVGRFLVNTTVGLAGFIDVAQHLDLNTPEEDTGQTLGFYGVKPGSGPCRVCGGYLLESNQLAGLADHRNKQHPFSDSPREPAHLFPHPSWWPHHRHRERPFVEPREVSGC
jgi:phospholipid-binding lipoprotein MlaA